MSKNVCKCCNGSGHKPDEEGIGRKLRTKRKGAGILQADMARRLGVSDAFLSQLETGKRHWEASMIQKYELECVA